MTESLLWVHIMELNERGFTQTTTSEAGELWICVVVIIIIMEQMSKS